MKMYKETFLSQIKEVEILRQTKNQVIYLTESGLERRVSKVSDWRSFHETKDAAKDYIINKKMLAIDEYRQKIQKLESEIEKIKAL